MKSLVALSQFGWVLGCNDYNYINEKSVEKIMHYALINDAYYYV